MQFKEESFINTKTTLKSLSRSKWWNQNSEEFINYLSGLLIFHYLSKEISEEMKNYISQSLVEYKNLEDYEVEECKENYLKDHGYFIWPSQMPERILKSNSGNLISSKLNTAFHSVIDLFEDGSNSWFSEIDFNSSKLGATPIERNNTILEMWDLIKKIEIGENSEFKNYQDVLIELFSIFIEESRENIITPNTLSELMVNLAITEKDKIDSIYDPTLGVGNLLFKAVDIIGAGNIENGVYAQEVKDKYLNISKLLFLIGSLPKNFYHFENGNTLMDPYYWGDKKFEIILADLPINLKWRDRKDNKLLKDKRFSSIGLLPPHQSADWAFILHCLHLLSDNGIAVIATSPSVLYRNNVERKIRKYLIENNYIDAIIQLPANLLNYSNIPIALIILKKQKPNQDVLFINASDFYIKEKRKVKFSKENIKTIVEIYKERKNLKKISRRVPNKLIKEEEYNLNPLPYLISSLKDNLAFWTPLEKSVELIRLGTHGRNQNDIKENEARIVTINNLNQEYINNPEFLMKENVDRLNNKLKKGDILVTRNFLNFKAALYDIEDNIPTLTGTNVYIIRPDRSKIDPWFLLAYFNSKEVQEEITGRASGTNIKILDRKTLGSLPIPILSIEDQQRIGKEYLRQLIEKEKLERKLNNIKKDIKEYVFKNLY